MPCSYELQGWLSKLITIFYLFVEIYHLIIFKVLYSI
nr:MAG TPA: hypothetical protein [Caudoviricetes sp.]